MWGKFIFYVGLGMNIKCSLKVYLANTFFALKITCEKKRRYVINNFFFLNDKSLRKFKTTHSVALEAWGKTKRNIVGIKERKVDLYKSSRLAKMTRAPVTEKNFHLLSLYIIRIYRR